MIRLLAGDSLKTWILTERPSNPLLDCELDNQLNLFVAALGDTLGYSKNTGVELCSGEIEGILQFGLWTVQDNQVKDSLVTILNGDSSFHAIEFITSQTLTLTYQNGGSSQQLTYSLQAD